MNAEPLAPEPGTDGVAGRAQAVRRLELRDFRNYAHVALEPAPRADRAAWRQRRRQDQPAGGGLAAEPGPRPAAAPSSPRSTAATAAPWSPARRCRRASRARSRSRPATTATPSAAARWPTAKPLRSQNALGEHLSLLWLTPAMDRLFAEGAAGRRRFLDRLVLAIDPAHAARVAAFERASRERSHLLRAGRRDPAWLGAIEQRIAEAAVAVTAARRELVADLDGELARAQHHFPRPRLVLVGELESWLDDDAGPRGRAAAGGVAGRESRARTRRAAAPRSGRTAATWRPPTRCAASRPRAARPAARRPI